MAKKRINKAGFRVPEIERRNHRRYFLRKFCYDYPNAIDELKELLPLVQSLFGVYGEFKEFDVEEDVIFSNFNNFFMLPRQEIISLLPQCRNTYPFATKLYRRKNVFPENFQMSSGNAHKPNQEFYKTKVETSLIWSIAEIKAHLGDTTLLVSLNQIENTLSKIKEDYKVEFSKNNKTTQNNETEAEKAGYGFVIDHIEENKTFEIDIINNTLSQYWNFYQKFHKWLDKYILQETWIRKIFFVALLKKLQFFEFQGEQIILPYQLEKELHGDVGFFRTNFGLPNPETFGFHLNESHHNWQISCFSLLDSIDDFKAFELEKFEKHLESLEIFKGENRMLDSFNEYIENKTTNYSKQEIYETKKSFREHILNFELLKDVKQNYQEVIKLFNDHLTDYLEELLPMINKHYKTKQGRKNNFSRVNWLISWNVENLTVPQILEKYSIGYDETTFWKAMKKLSTFGLPLRAKNAKKV